MTAKVHTGADVILIPARLRLGWIDVLAMDHRLSHVAFRVACVIGRHFNKRSGDTFIKNETIASVMGVSKRTVWTAIRDLEEAGYLIVERRELGRRQDGRRVAGGRGAANEYKPGLERSQLSATKGAEKLAAICDHWWEERSQKRVTKVAASCDPTLNPPSGDNPTRAHSACAREALGKPGARLGRRIGDSEFASWFSQVQQIGVSEKTVRLSAPTAFIANAIRTRYGDAIIDAWRADHPEVRFCKITVVPAGDPLPPMMASGS